MVNGFRDKPHQVACGRCDGCLLDRSRQWAIRCDNERQMHDQNSFLTLTYSPENLIYGGNQYGTLVPDHLMLFWKRLRKRIRKRIRYFACGEYGDKFSRPHYHACLFGFDFPDKTWDNTKNGNNYYHSDMLDDIWGHGRCVIGDVTFESAAYVARYILGKKFGKDAQRYKQEGIEPEFVRMSRRPGIGSEWLDKFQSDVYPHDYMVIRNGIKVKPPKYYNQKYLKSHPLDYEDIQERRKIEAIPRMWNNTPERLRVRERVKKAQTSLLLRNYHKN